MIQVTRKDNKEGLENLIRRFNRKVASAGVIATVKNNEFFTKPISKRERREKAIIRKARKNEKNEANSLRPEIANNAKR
jgi:ribosomal protein S21